MAFRGATGYAATANTQDCVIDVSGLGIQNGDIVILCGNVGGGGTISFPAGFADIPNLTAQTINNGGATTGCAIAWKLASGEGSSYTIHSTVSNKMTGTCRVYSGRAASPFVVASALSNTATAATPPVTLALTGLTPNAADDVVVIVPGGACANITAVNGYTPAAGYANDRIDISNVTQYSPAISGSDYVNWSGGATGTIGGQLTSTSTTTIDYVGYVMALARGEVSVALTGTNMGFSI